MKLTVTTFITLDGIGQAPGGQAEDPSGGFEHGGWMMPFVDEDFGRAATLKTEPGRELQVHGSLNLTQTLVTADLVDEFHVLVFPVVLGEGKRLFDDIVPTALELVDSETTSTGAMLQTYRPTGRPECGEPPPPE